MFYEFENFGSTDFFKSGMAKNQKYAAHLHRSFEIIIILSGEMQITVDSKVFSLKENQAVLIFPNQIHSLHSEKCEHLIYIFSPDIVKTYSNKVKGVVPVNNVFCPSEYLIDELKKIDKNANICEKKGLLYSFCGQFEKTATYEPKKCIMIEFSIRFLCLLKKISTVNVHSKNFLLK